MKALLERQTHKFLFGTAGIKGVADEIETHTLTSFPRAGEQPRWRMKKENKTFKKFQAQLFAYV